MGGGIALLIGTIPFLILGIVFSKGKGADLIAGYNTLPESEKEKYDKIAMCKFMGKIMYGICVIMLLFAVSEIIDNQMLFISSFILFTVLILFTVIYTNTGNRFMKSK